MLWPFIHGIALLAVGGGKDFDFDAESVGMNENLAITGSDRDSGQANERD